MANYGIMALTTQGLALFTKAQAGTPIVFTKMQVGSGSLGNINPQSLTALIQPQFDVSISGITKDTVNMMAYVAGTADNSAIATQLYVNELGLFATDPDVGEILYGYANAGSAGDYIPPASAGSFTRRFTVNAAVGNAPNVTVVIPSNKYATLDSNGLVLSSQLPSASTTKVGVVELSSNPPSGQPAVVVYKGDFDEHKADDVNHVPYAVATGVANTYAVTLNPAPTAYIDGMAVAVKVNVASTGASTLNINGLGAKAIKDSLGNAITSGGLKANIIYSMRYEATSGNFIVQGKGGGGNASSTDLYLGTTATVDTGQIVGTNPYKIGATVRDNNFVLSSGGQGVQIWAKTDTPSAYGIAIDSSGNVYVAYGYAKKLDSSGNQIWNYGAAAGARKVAVDSSGNVYVAYYNASGDAVVKKLNSSGVEVWTLTDIGYAYDIAVDSSGNVYVAYRQSAGATTVRKLNSSGTQVWALTDLATAQSIAVDSAGNVYVAYYNAVGTTSVRKLNSSGVQIWAKTDIGYAYSIAVDSSGNVYVVYENTVRKLDSLGTEVWVNSQVPQPRGIAVDQFGNVYVAYDTSVNTTTVRRFYPSGTVAWSLSDVGHAQDVAVDSSGIIYVAYFNSSGTTQVRKLYGIAYYTLQ
jgi:hypothetical protein